MLNYPKLLKHFKTYHPLLKIIDHFSICNAAKKKQSHLLRTAKAAFQ